MGGGSCLRLILTRFQRYKNFPAFTLAEVLITLGIIGVVAAMTIPTLITKINDIRFRSQFMKSYSIIAQTLKTMEDNDVYIETSNYNRNNDEIAYKTFEKYLKNTVDCGEYNNAKNISGCFNFKTESYYNLNGKTKFNSSLLDDGQLLMPDGSLLIFEQPNSSERRVWIFVDVNGKNRPNRLGEDLFAFQLLDSNVFKPMGADGTTYAEDETSSKYCSKTGANEMNGISCANKLLKEQDGYYKWLRRSGS